MKIVFLSSSGQLGGAERSLLDVLSSLRQARPDWPLSLVAASRGPLLPAASALGVRCHLLPFPRQLALLGDAGRNSPHRLLSQLALLPRLLTSAASTASYVWQLSRLLRTLTPDVIHANGLKMHLLGKWAKLGATPIVWHIHDYISPRPVMSALLRRSAGGDVIAVANSKSVAKDVVSVCGARLETHAVYNRVDLALFSPDGSTLDLDSLAGLPPAPPATIKIGLIATLAFWKGHAVFLKTLSLLRRDLPVRGYIIGDAIYQTRRSQQTIAQLRGLASRLGIAEKVGFTGFIKDISCAVRTLDIVVHASTEPEPFGRVIVEAMACAKPVIVSWAGGAVELVTIGSDALGHPPGDAQALASALTRLVDEPGLRTRLGQAGRATVERRFDRAGLADDMIPIYQRAARGRP